MLRWFDPKMMRRRWSAMPLMGLLAVAACGGAAPSASAPSRQDSSSADAPKERVSFTRFRLKNGLDVVLTEDHRLPIVAVDIRYKVGGRDDPDGKGGLAHLFEHLMFEGTAKLPHDALLARMDEVGQSYLNASTAIDSTDFVEQVASRGLDFVLWMEADRMATLGAAVTAKKLDGARKVVEQERRESVDDAPRGCVSQAIDEALYPKGHPYRRAPIGTIAELESITLDDVQRFFATYYTPDDATLVVVGDFDVKAARHSIEAYFGPIPRGSAHENAQPTASYVPATPQRLTIEADVSDALLVLTWAAPPWTAPGDFELDGLTSIEAEVGEPLVAQGVVTGLSIEHPSATLGSRFDIGVTAAAGTDLDALEKTVREAFRLAAHTEPLSKALPPWKASYVTTREFGLDGLFSRADSLSVGAAERDAPDWILEEIDRISALDVDTVRGAYRKYIGSVSPIVTRVLPTPGAPRCGRLVSKTPMPATAATTTEKR